MDFACCHSQTSEKLPHPTEMIDDINGLNEMNIQIAENFPKTKQLFTLYWSMPITDKRNQLHLFGRLLFLILFYQLNFIVCTIKYPFTGRTQKTADKHSMKTFDSNECVCHDDIEDEKIKNKQMNCRKKTQTGNETTRTLTESCTFHITVCLWIRWNELHEKLCAVLKIERNELQYCCECYKFNIIVI